MQFLTQTLVALLLLWNIAVSQSASTAGREFLSRLPTRSDNDVSEESANAGNKDVHGRQDKLSESTWIDNQQEVQPEHLATKHVNYGTAGYVPREELILSEDAMSKALPPNLFGTMDNTYKAPAYPYNNRYDLGAEDTLAGRREYDYLLRRSELDEDLNEENHALAAHLRDLLTRPGHDNGQFPLNFPSRFFINTKPSFVVPPTAFRTSKRSPGCLRKCMAQGFLHPSQCHSLC